MVLKSCSNTRVAILASAVVNMPLLTIYLRHNQLFNRHKTIVQLKFVTDHWLLVGVWPGSWVPGVEACWRSVARGQMYQRGWQLGM